MSFIPEDLKKEMDNKINDIGKRKKIKKDTKKIWDLIKEKVKIPDLVQLEDNRCECLQFGNTTTPSCQYNDMNEILYCHKCKKTMDVIKVYAILNNLEHSEAIKTLAKQYDIPFGKVDEKHIKIEKEIQKLFQDFMEKCHNNSEFQNKYALIEMKKRGFTKETIETFKIGLFDDSIKDYMNITYSKELLQNAGFKDYSKKDKEKKGKLYWKWGKRIVYPYLNQNNKPEYFIYRLIDSEPDFNENAKYIKQLRTDFVQEIPFGLDSIYELRKKPLIITEGMTDAISVIQTKYPCLSPITVRIKKSDIEKIINYCKRFKKVVVINDNEKLKRNKEGEFENSGLKGAIDTLKVLIYNNINCYIGIIPNPEKLEKIDLDDYLKPDLTNVDDKNINAAIENSLGELEEKLNELIQESTPGLEFLINTINEKSTQKELLEILEILPENDFITQEDVFKKLAKKRNLTLDTIKKIYKQYQEEKLLKEQKQIEIDPHKEDEKENNEDVFERLSFDNYDIEVRKDGIFKITWRKIKGILYPNETPIFKGKLEILFKTYDTVLDVDRFTFLINGMKHNTFTIMKMINKFEDKIYEGTSGRDIIKKVFNYFSDKIENRHPEYILGFNKGWILPQREIEGKYAIIIYTDIDKKVYKNAQKCIKNHTNKEKQGIIEKVKLFIITTQTPPIKLLKIITWSITCIFRMPIIDFFKIFPLLYNYGERNAGKGSLEEFWIVHFYRIHKKLLPSKTLESASRLEDYLASSTFPIAITEVDGRNIRNTLSIIKEHASDNTDFERKKPDQTLAFSKPKTAGLCLDSNIIIDEFNDSALNSKCIMNEFKKKDIPKIDFEWKKLFRELKKEKLFSFIYNATKDWDNKTIFNIFNKIIEETKENLPDYKIIEKTHPRILSTYQICLFGLYVWNLSFGFSLEQIFKIGFNEILDSLISGRKIIPSNLLDQFYRFCLTAINFEEDYEEEYTSKEGNSYFKTIRGNNPKYLTCALKLTKDGFHYGFTQDNLRDFNEYTNTKYNLKNLPNKLEDGLDDKNDIIWSKCYPFSANKQERVILINKEWLEDY